jgi:hypothetical protein
VCVCVCVWLERGDIDISTRVSVCAARMAGDRCHMQSS